MISSIASLLAAWLFQGFGVVASYITNSNVFPKPLTAEEEAKLLERMSRGQDEEARNILIERNLRLVAHVVKKFDKTGEDPDDLISIGTIGLIKAINTFNPKKNTRLATYAARCIENEVLMHLRSTKKTRSEVKLYEPIGSDREGNEISLIDILGSDPEEVLEEVELHLDKKLLREKLQHLTKREREVLQLRFGLADAERKTQREISKKMGISRSYVSRIEKKALSKLYEQMSYE